MPIGQSLAGRLGSAAWRQNPMIGLGLAFGVGAGAYAGVHTYAATEGTFSERSEAAAHSGGNYLLYGGLGMAAGLTALPYAASWPVGFIAGRTLRRGPGAVGKYFASAYKSGAAESGFLGGVGRIAERKMFMAGAGAAIGAALGSHLDKDNPNRGAARGAVIGGGAGLAVSAGLRASRLWKGFNPLVKLGAIGTLSAAAFGAASVMTRPRYASVDQAMPEDNGLRDLMNTIGAHGDLVFGLHNSR